MYDLTPPNMQAQFNLINKSNQRIKLSQLAKSWYDKGINNLLDAGLVGKNLRDKKFMGKPLSFFRYKDYSLQFKPRMPMNLQSNFKYIVHVDGHVSAYRLGKELSLGSCILKVESLYNYKLWFSHLMIPNAHYLLAGIYCTLLASPQ